MIKGQRNIQRAYQDEEVARQYVDRRFTSPLGAMLHARQAAAVRALIRAESIAHALEIAPGPARVTVDTAPQLNRVTLIDASAQMLEEARRRLHARQLTARTTFVRGDAFHLPVRAGFDLAYSFRLIRHFTRDDRLRLYRQIAAVLRPGGWLVFDAVNADVSGPLRARAKPGEYEHYDALVRPDELRHELDETGFQLVSLQGVQHRIELLNRCQIYIAPRSARLARVVMNVVDRLGGKPLEWIVVCRRG